MNAISTGIRVYLSIEFDSNKEAIYNGSTHINCVINFVDTQKYDAQIILIKEAKISEQ